MKKRRSDPGKMLTAKHDMNNRKDNKTQVVSGLHARFCLIASSSL